MTSGININISWTTNPPLIKLIVIYLEKTLEFKNSLEIGNYLDFVPTRMGNEILEFFNPWFIWVYFCKVSIVIPVVVGSSPISHPKFPNFFKKLVGTILILFRYKITCVICIHFR